MDHQLLSVANLRKAFRSMVAVDGVSFHVDRNEIVGLLGPNGAGKTTIINMVLGVVEPTSGSIEIDGLDARANRRTSLERTNFAAVYAPVPGNLTVAQNLRVFGLLYGVTDLSASIDLLLDRFELRRFRDVKCGVPRAGLDFVPTLLGAVLLWDFFARVMQGVTTAFLEDVWSRNFLNLFATPLSIGEYLTGLVASSVVTSAIGLVVMLVLATTLFGLSFVGYGAALGPFLLVLFVFGIALGIAASALVLWLGPASEWLIWPIPALVAPFAGVFYPTTTLPRWMQVVSRVLPPSPVFDGMRAVVSGRGAPVVMLVWAACLAVLYLGLACVVFGLVYRRAVRVGLIARYSAENIS